MTDQEWLDLRAKWRAKIAEPYLQEFDSKPDMIPHTISLRSTGEPWVWVSRKYVEDMTKLCEGVRETLRG